MSEFQKELDKCPILQGFTKEETLAFLERVRFEDFASGAEILTEGNQYQGLWIILNGTCEVVKKGASKLNMLAKLEPGNVFGEMSFLQSATHSASVKAVGTVQTMRLMIEDFRHLHETCHTAADKITYNIIRILSDRLRKMDQWACEYVENDKDKRKHEEWHEFRARLYTDLYE